MNYTELNHTRRAHRDYDPAIKISRETLNRILNAAALAPSCNNVQGYKVIAVLTDEEKKRLHPISFKQPQVLSASAMLIVLGNTQAYKGLRHIMEQTPGTPQDYIERTVATAEQTYGTNERFARDEAIRSVGLFAMNFMMAALNEGFETGPMIGFDAKAVSEAYNIEAPYFPALMISVGKAKSLPFPRGYRIPAEEFTRYV